MSGATIVQLNIQFWKEGNMFVAYIPQLDLATCGETLEQARKNIKDATEGFFEATDRLGTTKELLEEAGFLFDREWRAPEVLSLEKLRVTV